MSEVKISVFGRPLPGGESIVRFAEKIKKEEALWLFHPTEPFAGFYELAKAFHANLVQSGVLDPVENFRPFIRMIDPTDPPIITVEEEGEGGAA